MGYYYNSACSDQSCSSLCCNYYGSCPDYYSYNTYSNQCWYTYSYYDGTSCSSSSYYSSSSSSNCCYSSTRGYYSCSNTAADVGAIIGGVVGGVIGMIFLIVIIVVLCKKCRQQAMPVTQAPANGSTVIISGGGANYGPPPVYGQYPPPGYSQPFQGQPAYGQPYGQPYIQPAYGQPQPFSSPQDNPQYPPVYLSNMNSSPIK